MYKTIPVNIVGGSNPSRSKAFNQERTLNLYPEPASSGAYPAVLYPWPGTTQLTTTDTGAARGIYQHSNGKIYKVGGNTLYEVDADGTETSLGSIHGNGYVIMADDGTSLTLTTTTAGYIWDGTTLSTISDSDYEAGGSVAILNNQAIYQGFNQRFSVSSAGDAAAIGGLSYATAERSGDSLKRVFVFRETLYLMGSRTIESWYNSGVGDPPFDRIQNGTMEVGLISRGAADSNDNFMYWLADDSNLYRASAYQAQPLMPPSIHKEFLGLDLTNSRVVCLTFDAQNFILILTSSKSWCYSETTSSWFELAYTADELPYIGYDYAGGYMLSRIDSKVLKLDFSSYTDDSEIIIRERITPPITGAHLGKEGGRFMAKRAEIIAESGIGTDSSTNPKLMVSHSVDGGQSWSSEQWIKAGRNSENNLRVEYYFVDTFRQIQFKLRSSDPNFFNFQSMALDVRIGGHY